LAQPIGLGLGPCRLRVKKAHIEKKPPLKKPTGLKTLQNPCGLGPTHGLSSST